MNPEEHRYYLLPGMGRANRLHRKKVDRIVLAIGLLIAVMVAGLLYLIQSF